MSERRKLECRRIAVWMLLLAIPGVCVAQEEESAFIGRWRGSIEITASYGAIGDPEGEELLAIPREFSIRILRNGDIIVRSRASERSWSEHSMPFALFEWGENAVIVGQNRSEAWVETVTFNITRVDEETLFVYWWRVVNNLFIHPDDRASKFAFGGYGELHR